MDVRTRSIDTGYAWVICGSAFVCHMIHASSWASFGLFYDELVNIYPNDSAILAWMYAIMSTVWGVAGVFVGKMIQLFGCRKVTIMGAVSGAVGVLVCSFSHDVTFLCIWYGIFVGLACSAIETPAFAVVQQNFDKRRARANGLSNIGATVGIFIFPPLFRFLITKYTWRGTFFIQSAIYLHAIVAALLFYPHIKPAGRTQQEKQNPDGENKSVKSIHSQHFTAFKIFAREIFSFDQKILTNCNFYVFGTASVFFTCMQPIPLVFLVPRATSHGIAPQMAALLMSCWAAAGGVGLCVFGWIADKWSRVGVCGLAIFLAGLSSAAMSMFQSFPLLCVYAISFGFSLAGYFATAFPSLADIVGAERVAEAYGLIKTLGGIMSLAALPFADWITRMTGQYHAAFIVSGCVMCVAGLLCFMVYVSTRCRNRTKYQSDQGNVTNKALMQKTDDTVI